MITDFTTTVALVTGGNRGLGRAFVDELLRLGATVYMGARWETPASPSSRINLATRLRAT